MTAIPDRGDIVHLRFDPASGHEMKGDHYALVVSPKLFNQLGLAFVCPVSQGVAAQGRNNGFVVSLGGTGLDTQGNVHVHQLKSLDWRARKARKKERVPGYIMDEVLARLQAIIDPE